MKRLLFGLAFAGGFALSLMATRHLVPAEVARAELSRSLSVIAGTAVELQGAAEISVFPTLKVRFRDARLIAADTRAALAEMEALSVRLEVLPLLIGRLEPSEVVLEAPRLSLERRLTAQGLLPGRAALAAVEPTRLVVERGRLELRDPDTGRVESVDNLAATFVWPRSRSGASLQSTFRWRGEPVAVALQGLGPRDLAAGAPGAVSVTLTAAPLRVAFDGKGMLGDMLQLDGAVELAAADPARAAAWLGWPDIGLSLPHDTSLTGRMRSLGFAATVSDARLAFAGNEGEGMVSVRLDAPRPQLRGTLAFDELDLTGPAAGTKVPDWHALRTDRSTLAGADLDLRLSASTVQVAGTALKKVAASLLLKDGRLDAELGEATLLGGTARLVLRGEAAPDRFRATGRLTAGSLALGPVAAAIGFAGIEDGRLAMTVEAEATGSTLGGLVEGLRARLAAEARGVVLRSVDAVASGARFLPIALKNPVAARAPTFERAVADAELSGGTVRLRRLDADGPAISARLGGEASLLTGLLNLDGVMLIADRSAEPRPQEARRLQIPIRIGGTLAEPVALVHTAEGPFARMGPR